MTINKQFQIVTALLCLGLIFRVLFVFVAHPPERYLYSDMQGYYERSVKYASGEKENIYDSLYPPATHFIYSIFFKLPNPFFWIKLFNVCISTTTCLLIYLITKDLFGQRAGYLSLAISSLDYIFIDFTGYFLSETLFTFMLALMFYCFLKSVMETSGHRWLYSLLAGQSIIIAGAVKS